MSDFFCRFPIERYPAITLAHGGGGRLTQQLVEQIFRPIFQSSELEAQGDGAILNIDPGRLAFSTDSYVVRPVFFPGGDIGSLAVTGTCNDLAMCGARPKWLSVGMILEEGFSIESLIQITRSMAASAAEIGVTLVTGDTKVVERGKGDGVYINTSGVGVIEGAWQVGPSRIEPDDVILLSGAVGKHGTAILSVRQGLDFSTTLQSDCAHLWPGVEAILKAGLEVHALRDLTRGGLATALIELSQARSLEFLLQEDQIAVDPQVRGACAMLGLDPLFVANEGRMIVIVKSHDSQRALELLKSRDPDACQIGKVLSIARGRVQLETRFGSKILLEMQSGEQLPRIC